MGKKLLIFILIISFLLLNSGFILILYQNINNLFFYYETTKEIIAEKFVYEQFSHEIYSNINSKIYYDIKKISIKDECDEGYDIIKFPIRIEYLYDCEDVHNDAIDKNKCQNRITNPNYCCAPSCCRDYIIKKEKYHFCSKKKFFSYNDPRNDICSYISIYNGKFYYVNNIKYCAKRLNKKYEELLSEFNQNKNCDIEFDTKKHYFCSDDYNYIDYNYTFSSTPIIVENIFSTVPPNYINIENTYRISMLLNKKKYDESKALKELNKLKEISEKNIRDAFKKSDESFYSYYRVKEIFNLGDLISGDEPVFEKFKGNNFFNSLIFLNPI